MLENILFSLAFFLVFHLFFLLLALEPPSQTQQLGCDELYVSYLLVLSSLYVDVRHRFCGYHFNCGLGFIRP